MSSSNGSNIKSKSSARKAALGKAAESFMRYLVRRVGGKSPAQVEQMGRRYGQLMWSFAGKRRQRTRENLRLAFPNRDSREIEQIARGVFIHFGRTSMDFLAGANRTKEEIEATTHIQGLEHLDAALAKGKGALLITGHLGNWERVSAWLSLSGYPLNVIARDADDEGVNSIVNEIRKRPGTKVISRGQAARQVLLKLRGNEIVGILPDQNASDIFIPFFGVPAGTALGPGVFQSRTQATVVPVACVYNATNRYTMTFYPPLEPHQPETSPGEGLMRAINAWLEDRIRETPEQWLWMHDRWRNARRKGLI
ncbi:MAG: lysophospholipid acyltransferase family protein [Armatimonadetes bacterium]|nr:lysophospholipid acyltransferase family protein [Armatimonadota bacterium]